MSPCRTHGLDHRAVISGAVLLECPARALPTATGRVEELAPLMRPLDFHVDLP
jgi:hypothetical protein